MINEERTFKEFGYNSWDLTHGSRKKVWRICNKCGKEKCVKYSYYMQGYVQCASCAQIGKIVSKETRNKLSIANIGKTLLPETKHKISETNKKIFKLDRGPFNIEYFESIQAVIDDGGINEIKTFNSFGYHSVDLSYGSHKEIWRICSKCKKETKVKYYKYYIGKKICKSCIKLGKSLSEETKNKLSLAWLIRGPFNIEYFQAVSNSIECGYINEIRTFDSFKYYSIDLHRTSKKEVWRVCVHCGKENIISYSQYTYGYFQCIMCANLGSKNSFYGKTHSEESRRKMSAAQQYIAYDEWEGYAKDKVYCPDFNEKCRESNREKYGRKCFICGCDESENITLTGKLKRLSVHHIDMDKQQGCNGHEWKLIPVCIHCHRSLHTKRMASYIEYILKDESKKENISK